jgi:hypothetical protein
MQIIAAPRREQRMFLRVDSDAPFSTYRAIRAKPGLVRGGSEVARMMARLALWITWKR